MNHPIIPFSLNGSNNRQQKIKIENRYYLDFIDQSIGLIEREEKEDSIEEEIMDFLNTPGWSLIPWKNLDIEEDDIKESNKRINFRVAIVRRGKRREKNLDKEGVHGNDSFDNLQRKIQVDFQNFIINFCNDALKAEYKRVRYSFKKINYKNKITVNFDYVSKLKSSSIKDLLNLEISDKYKAFNKNHNQIILSRIENEWLKKLFEMNYLEIFKYYYNNEKPLKKFVFEGKEIVLSSKTKSFSFLLDKNKKLSEKIIDTAKIVYFSDNSYESHFSTTNISLVK